MDKNEKKAYTSRSGRVGNFLVNEEVIEQKDAETLKRVHVSDVEHGWEVIVPQNYGSAFNIICLALEEHDEQYDDVLAWLFDNMFLVTTCMDGMFHMLIRDIALVGFNPAVNKKSVKMREHAIKDIKNRLKAFEFKQVVHPMTEEEERQNEINEEMKDVLDANGEE